MIEHLSITEKNAWAHGKRDNDD